MNINDVYPSKYLKAEDLQGREVTVTMSHVEIEKIGQGEDRKPVLYFVGKEKGVALNKTNSTNIASAFGPETDGWSGNKVTLYTAWVDYQGKSVQAIRVRPAFPNAQQRQQPSQQMAAPIQNAYANASQQSVSDPDLSDSIPF